ncbi:MAG: hypothetical protein SPL25_05285 [Succinivibrionaceae bacterium]|nr:hypothetical protein [Succinivibrionaceae bacterium]
MISKLHSDICPAFLLMVFPSDIKSAAYAVDFNEITGLILIRQPVLTAYSTEYFIEEIRAFRRSYIFFAEDCLLRVRCSQPFKIKYFLPDQARLGMLQFHVRDSYSYAVAISPLDRVIPALGQQHSRVHISKGCSRAEIFQLVGHLSRLMKISSMASEVIDKNGCNAAIVIPVIIKFRNAAAAEKSQYRPRLVYMCHVFPVETVAVIISSELIHQGIYLLFSYLSLRNAVQKGSGADKVSLKVPSDFLFCISDNLAECRIERQVNYAGACAEDRDVLEPGYSCDEYKTEFAGI